MKFYDKIKFYSKSRSPTPLWGIVATSGLQASTAAHKGLQNSI